MAGLTRIAQIGVLRAPRQQPATSGRGADLASPATGGSVLGRRDWLLTALAAGASAALMAWHLGRPALWRDETATLVAERRGWAGLWELFDGSEAPLVPYYALLKVLKGIVLQFVPGLQAHPEVLLRWPSALAVVVTGTLLVHWLTRVASPPVALCSGGLLLLMSGVSRYGQEARPYALVLMLATIATVLWWYLVQGRRWGWFVPYVAAIAAMVALNAISASLVAAHVVAAAILRTRSTGPGRWRGVLRAGLGGIAGVAIAGPLTLRAIDNGTGAMTQGDLATTLTVLLRLFNGIAAPIAPVQALFVLLIVVLPLVGVAGWFSPQFGDLVRLAVCWAVIPLALLLPAALAQPNLIASRYILFVLPAWSVLASLGLVSIARRLDRVVAQIDHRAVTAVHCLVLAASVAVVGAVQLPSLRSVRSASGHGENIRAVLAVLDRPEYRDLPIEVFPPSEAIEISAYAPAVMERVVNARQPDGGPVIWSQRVDGTRITRALDAAPGVIYVVRGGSSPRPPRTWDGCRVTDSAQLDRKWSYFVLRRAAATAPSSGRPSCDNLQ